MKLITVVATTVIILVTVAAACTPAAPGAAPATAAPQKTAAAAPAAGWQQKWEQTLAAARKEGELLLYLNAPMTARTAMPEAFYKAFGIRIDVIMGSGADLAAKMNAEYRAGVHQADLISSGGTSSLSSRNQGFLSPMEPMLVLPEVKDPSVWVGGKFPYFDKDGYIIGFLSQRAAPITYNTDMVKKDQVTSYLDLLKPEWKGKMSMFNPSVPGIANAAMSRLSKEWGVDKARNYLTDLLRTQQIVVTRDMGQQVDWLAKGKYPVAIWAQTPAVSQYLRAGAPIADFAIKEKVGLSASNGGLAIPTAPPHPNATVIFLNWFLGKEGQTVAVKSMGFASTRADVPATGVDPMFVLKPGEGYIVQDEEMSAFATELAPQWREVLAQTGY
ncbi:MAG: extracellular solute-binding protein [Chloroflexi bacterium]|nr:extracellular solute-binding protein [Chloroflexota bacterium]